MMNVKNLHKEPVLNLIIIAILFFFALNRFISHQPETFERYAAWVMQPILSTQQTWINYWKRKDAERMSVADALAELDKVQHELAWTQAALAEIHAQRQSNDLMSSVTNNLAITENSARPEPVEGYERLGEHQMSRTQKRHHELHSQVKKAKLAKDHLRDSILLPQTHPGREPEFRGPQLRLTQDERGQVKPGDQDNKNDLIAPILLKSLSDENHFLLIEGGTDQGLEPDMVCVYQNNLIGRITEVYDHISKVLLVTDRSCKVSALCSEHQVHGIYEGGNSAEQGKLCHVSHLFDVQNDDVVITTGEGLLFPRGYMLGRITHAKRAGVNYEISVKPFVDIRAITAVAILPSQISGMPKPEQT